MSTATCEADLNNFKGKIVPLPAIELIAPTLCRLSYPGTLPVDRALMRLAKGSRAVASRSKASCLGLALRNARWFESSWGKTFSHEISASVWDRCPPSIVMHLGSCDRQRNPVANASYNGWGDHRANHTIPPFWLDDRPPLLRHVDVRPAAGWSV
ncbi:hypothetical protein ANN_26964 [Periplaneta americana]|uniref:Uncharacterized protein n=1 Tax=Periplaneta americana TaxID=6978 RepID=A0ABQ8RX02_PERAM|nr:hypothetical protein ANN_26964 [Periplaneta americana]